MTAAAKPRLDRVCEGPIIITMSSPKHHLKGPGSPHYGEKISKVCVNCGAEFVVRYGLKARKVCSKPCHVRSQLILNHENARNTAAKFWARVGQPDPVTGCRLWLGGSDKDGYGKIKYEGRFRRAHQVAFELATGVAIPADRLVMHSCDTPPCCEPLHLTLGTNKNNMDDMLAKGRQAKGDRNSSRLRPERLQRGEEHHGSKLSDDDVRQIRALYGKGTKRAWSISAVSKRFNVSYQTIWRAATGRGWKHVV
jgi:HNH endonuclease